MVGACLALLRCAADPEDTMPVASGSTRALPVAVYIDTQAFPLMKFGRGWLWAQQQDNEWIILLCKLVCYVYLVKGL